MLLKVLTPNKLIVKEKVAKIIGEDIRGSFAVLPKHIDFITKLVPSILTYFDEQGEGFIATDEGLFIKHGDDVQIAVREGYESRNLGQIHEMMEKHLYASEEEEEQFGKEGTKLELGIVSSFYHLEKMQK